MAQVLRSPSHFPSPTSSASTSSLQIQPCASPTHHDTHFLHCLTNSSTSPSHSVQVDREIGEDQEQGTEELSALELLVTVFRKSLVGGCSSNQEWCSSMEIGLPTDVRHVAHVTFDRFDGFLGLPDEFEPEVPRRPPSASTRVFGVSTQSMQLYFDSRGNSVPTILLMMQRRLYELGGLQAEGIFRINAENSQEEYVRDQLNRGVVPIVIDVHCLAGLIKAWFRELPTGVLDSLSPEQVLESQSEEECSQLVKLLPPTESALLNWAINLMADVAQLENLNKMNARNIAMVFAPNMTQMLDPLTALMYAVQVMNFLKTLIEKTMRERQECVAVTPQLTIDPSDENGHQSFCITPQNSTENKKEAELKFVSREPEIDTPLLCHDESSPAQNLLTSIENLKPGRDEFLEVLNQAVIKGVEVSDSSAGHNEGSKPETLGTRATSQLSNPDLKRKLRKGSRRKYRAGPTVEKSKGIGRVSSIDSSTERIEAWR